MQETRNNCFGSEKRSTTLRQAKTGKHENRNVTAKCYQIMLKYTLKFFPLLSVMHEKTFVRLGRRTIRLIYQFTLPSKS